MIRNRYKYIPILLIAILLVAFPNSSQANSKADVEQVINSFYDAIIKQNFGIAANHYSVPNIGESSDNTEYQSLTSVTDYFNYVYSQSDYTLTHYEITRLTEIEENTFHASILLSGEGSAYDDGLQFTQNVAATIDEDGEWKLSLEGYIEQIKDMASTKSIAELSNQELIYRFFTEIENGNYGVAADITSPLMSDLTTDSHAGIVEYLKEWNKSRNASRNTPIQSKFLYILNEFNLDDEKSVYVISSEPFRRLTNNSPFSSPSTRNDSFIQIDNIKGESLINLSDSKTSLENIGAGEEEKSKGGNNWWILLVAVPIIVLLVYALWRVLFNDSDSSSQIFSTYTSNNNRATPNVDITTSVDQLLGQNTPVSTNQTSKPKPKTNVTLEKRKDNPTRKIHVAGTDSNDKPAVHIPTSAGRKIHVAEQEDSGQSDE